MKRLHVHVSVDDLKRSVGFYSALFAAQAGGREAGLREMDARRSAREFRHLDARPATRPRSSRHSGREPGRTARGLCAPAQGGRRVVEQGQTTCCYAKSEKSWIDDPAGISWETFLTTGESTDMATAAASATPRIAHERPAARRKRCRRARRPAARREQAVADRPYNVLFLCTGNSARSIIAEAILNKLGAGKFRAYSAGSQPKGHVHPETIRLLQSLGYDTVAAFARNHGTNSPSPAHRRSISSSPSATTPRAKPVPVWPGQPMTAHWGVPDPAEATGTPAEIALAFKDTYRMLYQRIGIFTCAAAHAASISSVSQQQI